jgi:hypothetical protein
VPEKALYALKPLESSHNAENGEGLAMMLALMLALMLENLDLLHPRNHV